jgi:hypothetical protein
MVVVLTSLAPTFATAQTGALMTGRLFVSIDGGIQATTNDFDDSASFTENAEQGQFSTAYTVDGGPALNIGGGALVWRRLGLRIGVSRFSRATPSTLRGAVPHPFFFNRAREVSGSVTGLKRNELAVHVQAAGVFPAGNRLQVMVFGGPSFFRVKQGVVNDFSYTDAYPYDTATFASTDVTNTKESKVGFNAGADVAFFFTRQLGVGGIVQFAAATVDAPSAGDGALDMKAGGLQAGGGLRVRF